MIILTAIYFSRAFKFIPGPRRAIHESEHNSEFNSEYRYLENTAFPTNIKNKDG